MSKIKTPTEPKERKAPVRNPRYEVARLEILEQKVISAIAAEQAAHAEKTVRLQSNLAVVRHDISELKSKIANGKEPQLPLD